MKTADSNLKKSISDQTLESVRAQHFEIVSDLIRQLPKAARADDKASWTTAVKQVMEKLAKIYLRKGQFEYFATLSSEGTNHREWLLDVLWYLKNKTSEGVCLGLESEWNDKGDEVARDFCKLLALKAPLKIMLFESGKLINAQAHIASLNGVGCRWLQHAKGDLIYAINFQNGSHSSFFYETARDGQDSAFCLKQIEGLSGADGIGD